MTKSPYNAANHCIYLSNGVFDGPSTLPHIIEQFEASGDTTMVVHFHGGLVPRSEGEKAAQILFDACYGQEAYPIFFVWESGIGPTLREALPNIVRSGLFKVLLHYVSRFALGKIAQGERATFLRRDGTRGASGPFNPEDLGEVREQLRTAASENKAAFTDRNPHLLTPNLTLTKEEEVLFERELQNDTRFAKEVETIAGNLAAQGHIVGPAGDSLTRGAAAVADSENNVDELLAPQLLADIKIGLHNEGADDPNFQTRSGLLSVVGLHVMKQAAVALKNVVNRFIDKRDHGVQATIVEEILRAMFLGDAGREVWDTMKDFTRQSFGDDNDKRGGTQFLKALQSLETQGKLPKRIVLSGHSTGAIYICHFLKAAKVLLPTTKFEILLLAPACDFKLLADTLAAHSAQISHLRIFGMSDDVEHAEFLLEVDELKNFPLLQKVYPGSLLYFVSGVLENESDFPLVGMARYYSGREPYGAAYPEIAAVKRFLDGDAHSFVWSIADKGDGLSSASQHHGDFDNDSTTLKSLRYLVSNGF